MILSIFFLFVCFVFLHMERLRTLSRSERAMPFPAGIQKAWSILSNSISIPISIFKWLGIEQSNKIFAFTILIAIEKCIRSTYKKNEFNLFLFVHMFGSPFCFFGVYFLENGFGWKTESVIKITKPVDGFVCLSFYYIWNSFMNRSCSNRTHTQIQFISLCVWMCVFWLKGPNVNGNVPDGDRRPPLGIITMQPNNLAKSVSSEKSSRCDQSRLLCKLILNFINSIALYRFRSIQSNNKNEPKYFRGYSSKF